MQTHSSKLFVAGIVCLTALALVSGCRKSGQKLAEHESQKLTPEQIKAEFQKQTQLPGARQTQEACSFLAQLWNSGRLPGSENLLLLGNWPAYTPQPTNYPMSRTVDAQTMDAAKKFGGKLWDLHYTVVKKSADNPWQLQKAWRTDTQGNTVEEYPIK